MHRERGRELRLVEQTRGAGVYPEPALLHHDVPLGVVLAEDRVGQPIRLQGEEQLGPARRELHVIRGGLRRRGRVQATSAGVAQDAVELVRDDPRAGAVFQGHDALTERRDAVAVPAAAGEEERVVRLVHPVEERPLRAVIPRPDRRAPLEEQVLQEVCDSGRSEVLVDATDPESHDERDGRGLFTWEHEDAHSVVEGDLTYREAFPTGRLRPGGRGEAAHRGDEDRCGPAQSRH